MRKLVLSFFLLAVCAPAALAQSDYNKLDVFAGFSHNRVDTGIGNDDPDLDDIVNEREGFNGFNVSVAGNVSRYVGLKADYAYHRKTLNVDDGVDFFEIKSSLHNLVGGVQLKDNAKDTKVRPFAHAMVGVAHATISENTFDISESETGLAGVFGGGIDIRVSKRVDFRVVQFDYNPTRLGGETQHNFRVGIGLVFR